MQTRKEIQVGLLAALPLMADLSRLDTGFIAAALVVLVYWIMQAFFRVLRWLIPAAWVMTLFWFTLGAAGVLGHAYFGLHIFWILSVYLLSDISWTAEHSADRRAQMYKEPFAAVLVQAVIFWSMAMLLVMLQHVLGQVCEIGLFQKPAGALLSFGALACVTQSAWFSQWADNPSRGPNE